ncbi:putative US22-like protein [Namao virus]|nr:putative US22-like protein [Namao virus]
MYLLKLRAVDTPNEIADFVRQHKGLKVPFYATKSQIQLCELADTQYAKVDGMATVWNTRYLPEPAQMTVFGKMSRDMNEIVFMANSNMDVYVYAKGLMYQTGHTFQQLDNNLVIRSRVFCYNASNLNHIKGTDAAETLKKICTAEIEKIQTSEVYDE